MKNHSIRFAIMGLTGVLTGTVLAGPQKMPVAPARVRGTIQSLTARTLTITTASGPVRVTLAPTSHYASLIPSDRAHVKPGSFLGITSVTQPNGSQRAVEIHVFPESMRGTGEGNYPWDWPGPVGSKGSTPHSKMTNGTVSSSAGGSAPHTKMTNGTVGKQASGDTLTLTYKGIGGAGTQPIVIPSGIPIVTFAPGTVQDLKPGAHVFVIATRQKDGALTADRILVGKNGLTPPM
ncbi:MAG: hypothetical protein JWN14_1669 [Chthonomonadales bacterium]|nr:hypothetical protein [Chthonomonadales bacterium]